MQFGGIDRTRAVIFSVLLHVLVACIVVFSIDFRRSPEPFSNQSDIRIVEAVAIDEQTVQQEVKRIKAAEERQRLEAERAAREAESKRKEEEEKLKRLQAEQERIERQKTEERKKLEAEKQRLAEDKKKLEEEKRRRAEEQKRLEQEQQRKAEEQKRLEQEQQRKAEEQKRLEEEKRKRAEEQKRLEEEKRKRAEEQKRLEQEQQRKAAEREAAAAEQLGRDQAEIGRYLAAIQNKVASAFIYPDLKEGLKCTLFVRMIPGGEVVETRVIESSGNPSFDRQAENAVRKAAPLPVPSDLRLFERMREIRFVFDPEK